MRQLITMSESGSSEILAVGKSTGGTKAKSVPNSTLSKSEKQFTDGVKGHLVHFHV
jgi:hypothetical protein